MVTNDAKLRYLKVKEDILEKILIGHWQVGEKLPGERKIAESMEVSQMTANRAIQELVKEGYLEREMGVGTFVVSKEPARRVAPRVNLVLFGELDKDEVFEKPLQAKTKTSDKKDYRHTYLTAEYLSKDIFMGSMLRSLMEAGYIYGLDFGFLTAATPEEFEYHVRNADRERESFVLINPLESWANTIHAASEVGLPMVAVSAHWDNMGIPFVDTDNYDGAKQAIKHLVDLGHRRIAVFYAWPETKNTEDRINGAKDTMKELGLEVDEEMFCNISDFGIDCINGTKDAIDKLLAQGKEFTAVFAGGFELALAVNAGLRSRSFNIPEDVSLIGFDDSPAAIYLQPPLTTVRQSFAEIAKEVLTILMKKKKESKIIPVELVIRNSTASCLSNDVNS